MPKPVIFIPGFPASELRDADDNTVFPPSAGTLLNAARKKKFFDAMLDIPGDLVAGPPIRSVMGIAKQAQSLYDILAGFGYTDNDFAPIGWDWRLGVDATPTLESIAAAFERFAPRPVIVLVHSTGALVFRAFLAEHPELENNIEQVLAFGGAWCGTLEALFAVHVGHSESILGLKLITAEEGANLIGHAQAAYDLFPPDPARTEMDHVQLVHGLNGQQAGANVDLSWIKAGRAYAKPLAKAANQRLGARDHDFGSLPMTNVVGWGGPTWPSAVLVPNDVVFVEEDKDFGDGTVPLASSMWITGDNVRTIVVPIGAFVANPIPDLHAHMWESLAVNQIFREVLEDAPRQELIAAAADADEALDFSSPVTVRMTAQSPDGKPLPNCIATAKINGAKIPVPFKGDVRAILRVKRDGITHNASNDIYRFTIDFKWDGGSRKNIAVAFRSV
ncbi:MAG: lipase/acyltransferase domain-containing protein [Thermoanaerobaculia bacterium]